VTTSARSSTSPTIDAALVDASVRADQFTEIVRLAAASIT
jgi:hypothetical protein